jgi:hypothetical protein
MIGPEPIIITFLRSLLLGINDSRLRHVPAGLIGRKSYSRGEKIATKKSPAFDRSGNLLIFNQIIQNGKTGDSSPSLVSAIYCGNLLPFLLG